MSMLALNRKVLAALPASAKVVGARFSVSERAQASPPTLLSPRLGCVFAQDRFQCGDEQIGIRFRKNQRWPQLDHIVMRPVRPGENAAVAQAVYDVIRLLRRRLAVFPVSYQI